MKNIYFHLAILLFCCISLHAQDWVPVTSTEPVTAKIQLEENNETYSVIRVQTGGFNLIPAKSLTTREYSISVEGMVPILEKGMPSLPKITASLIIPDNSGMEVAVVSSHFKDYPDIAISPSAGMRFISDTAEQIPAYSIAYQSNEFWPPAIAKLNDPYILRDYRGQVVEVTPFAYNPVTKTLRVYYDITLEVYESGNQGENPLVRRPGHVIKNTRNGNLDYPEAVSADFNDLYKSHFLNSDRTSRFVPVEEEGTMLILCYPDFIEEIEPYIAWKESEGIPIHLVNMDTVGYDPVTIKQFITDCYYEEGITFLLIVGDYQHIPTGCDEYGCSHDRSYTFIAGDDIYPEIIMGRFSAETDEDIITQVTRVIEYEKNPYLGKDWFSKATGLGFCCGFFLEEEYEWQHIRYIRSKLLDYTYTYVSELYDFYQGGEDGYDSPHADDVLNEVNDGRSLINYCGHGNEDGWATGDFQTSHIAGLNNNHMWPVIFAVACSNGAFPGYTCFAEAWVRARNENGPTGALVTMMNDGLMERNGGMYIQDYINELLVEINPDYNRRSVGGMAALGFLYLCDTYSAIDYVHREWTYFGDPSLMIRTTFPTQLQVIHPDTVYLGETSITINCQEENARVCLSLNDEILDIGFIKNGGCTINVPPFTDPTTIKITVVAKNYIPYISDIIIGSGNTPFLVVEEYEVNDIQGNNNQLLDYGEKIALSPLIKNRGSVNSQEATLTINTKDPYLILHNASVTIESISAGEELILSNAFEMTALDYTPDGHNAVIDYKINYGNHSWSNSIMIIIHNAVIDYSHYDIDDGTGNLIMLPDPGETVDLQLFINNIGSAAAYSLQANLCSEDPYVTILTQDMAIGTVDAGGAVQATFTIKFSADTPNGHNAKFDLTLSGDDIYPAIEVINLLVGQGLLNGVTANFIAESNLIKEYEEVQFRDYSDGLVLAYKWIFEGAITGTSSTKEPVVSYADEGVYDVTLIVTGLLGNDTIIRKDYITVEKGLPMPFTYMQDDCIAELKYAAQGHCVGENQLVIGDINNDGNNEIIAGAGDENFGNYWYIMEYDQTAHNYLITWISEGLTEGHRISFLDVFDADFDSDPDVVLGTEDGMVKIYEGSTKELNYLISFPGWTPSIITPVYKVLCADSDNDGETELVYCTENNTYFFNIPGYIFDFSIDIGGADMETGEIIFNPYNQMTQTIYSTGSIYNITPGNWEYLTTAHTQAISSVQLVNLDDDEFMEIVICGEQEAVRTYEWDINTIRPIYTFFDFADFRSMLVTDYNDDNLLDIIFYGRNHHAGIVCHDPVSGTKYWEIEELNGVNAVAYGDPDNDGVEEFVWAGRCSSSWFSGTIHIEEMPTVEREWNSYRVEGEFAKLESSDIEMDGELEVLALSTRAEGSSASGAITCLNAQTNAIEWQLDKSVSGLDCRIINDFAVNNLDDDQAPELILTGAAGSGTGGTGPSGHIMVIDGITHLVESEFIYNDLPPFEKIIISDLYEDGSLEMIASAKGIVYVINPEDYSIVWRTQSFGNSGYPVLLDAVSVDSDPELEILLSRGVLTIIDPVTRDYRQSSQQELTSFNNFDYNNDSVQDIVAGNIDGQICVIDGKTMLQRRLPVNCNGPVIGLKTINIKGSVSPELVWMVNGNTYFSDLECLTVYMSTQATGLVGSYAGCFTVEDFNNDGEKEIFTGTQLQISEYFSNCFECLGIELTITGIDNSSNVTTPNGAISVSITGGLAPYSFSWSTGDTTNTLSNLPGGTYSLSVTDLNGCLLFREITLKDVLGIEEYKEKVPFNIFPVPADDILYVKLNEMHIKGSLVGTAELISFQGRNILTATIDNNLTEISIKEVPPGAYFLKVQLGGKLWYKKVIIL